MTPIRPDYYEYEFSFDVMANVRKKLGLTQAKLAEFLDVPVNTVSRWETGATTPDAHTLAAIYSIAKRNNISPQFFQRRANMKQVQKQRTKLVLAWDFQNLGLKPEDVKIEWDSMRRYLDIVHSGTHASRSLRVYVSPYQREAQAVFEGFKFKVNEGYFDADSQLIQDAIAECEKKPLKTVFVLVSNDGNYTEFMKNLRGMGVDTYLWASDKCSEKLRKSIESGHFIYWYAPYVITTCIDVIKESGGIPITRSEFGTQCKNKLDEDEIYPGDAGFSQNNPYGSVLRWLETQGIISMMPVDEQSGTISIRMGNHTTAATNVKQLKSK